jgi:hypothetical protein
MLRDLVDFEQNIKPNDGENSLEAAQATVQDILTDHNPDVFAIGSDAEGVSASASWI